MGIEVAWWQSQGNNIIIGACGSTATIQTLAHFSVVSRVKINIQVLVYMDTEMKEEADC